MGIINASDFNLKATIESGQLFRHSYDSRSGFYTVIAGDSVARLRQEGDKLQYDCSNSDFGVATFFGLNHRYGELIKSISKDEKITAAINRHYGLRILQQSPWECTASFIISSFSNIPRIRQCIGNVAAAFGDSIEFDGIRDFSFPQPQQISNFSKLKKCGLGYRAKYLFETAKVFGSGNYEYSLPQMRKLSYAEAKEKMMRLPGVGEKVADCILLFSYGFLEAFPVDVWIQRAMLGNYGSEINSFAAGRKPSEKVVAGFARSYFGEYAGYAQQFLYHDARTSPRISRAAPVPLP